MQANSSKKSNRRVSNASLTIFSAVCLLLFVGGNALADGPVRDVVEDSAKAVEGATDATVDIAEDGTALAADTAEGATIAAGDTAAGTAAIAADTKVPGTALAEDTTDAAAVAADETAAAGADAANSAVTRAGKVPTGIAKGTTKAVSAPPKD